MSTPSPTPQESSGLHEAAGLPAATVRKRTWPISPVWVVPLAAAAVATYLVFGRLHEYGPMIEIRFKDASGVRVGQTDIEYRGVPIGQVKGLRLSADQRSVLVSVRLSRPAADVAREGSDFWIVRLQNGGLANFGAAVGTVFSGPYIQVLPGSGPPKREFVGLDEPPVVPERGALRIVLRTGNVDSIAAGTPVVYRGVQVGAVQDLEVNAAATAVEIHVLIRAQFAHLVRSNSRFSNVGGISAHFGLFKGLQISVPPLKTLVVGGIALSTPEGPQAKPARNGMEFELNDGAAAGDSRAQKDRQLARKGHA